MNQYVAFLISMAALVGLTWLVSKRGMMEPVSISFSDPRLESLIAMIPTIFLFGLLSFIWVGTTSQNGVTLNEGASPMTTYTLGDAFGQISLNLLILFPFFITMALRKQGWETMGLPHKNILSALLIGVLVSLVVITANGKLYAMFWLAGGRIFQCLGQVGVGFSEEAIFRGYLQVRFSAWQTKYGWILVAVLFCLWHLPIKLAMGVTSIAQLALSMTMILIYGLVAGWAMKFTGNILGLALIHAVINTVSDI
jgi:membrane protease YdiL (CAAX protease family)